MGHEDHPTHSEKQQSFVVAKWPCVHQLDISVRTRISEP